MFPADGRQTTTAATFSCQKCGEPLKIHTSLSALEPEALSEIAGRSEDGASATVLMQPVLVHEPSKMTDSDTNGNGFLIIGESGPSAGKQRSGPLDHRDLSYRLQVTSRLFDVLSDQSEIKHPLCEECADFIIDQMDAKLRHTEEECKVYREYEEALRTRDENEEQEMRRLAELTSQLELLEKEEQDLLQAISSVEKEEEKVQQELDEQNAQLVRMDGEESQYWQEYNNLKRTYFQSEDELQSVTNQLRYTQTQVEKLKRSNVFNITFHIWHCGHFGTINGFRLGRLPTVPVEWSEINAAWGQAALLLHCMAKKIDLTFQRFRLVPYGNFSFLESLDDRSKQLPL
jgi:beclin 1